MISANLKNDQHGIINPRVHQWHTYLDGKQQFSSCTYDTFNKREIMSGTGNLANYSGQPKSWTLEEKLSCSNHRKLRIGRFQECSDQRTLTQEHCMWAVSWVLLCDFFRSWINNWLSPVIANWEQEQK